MINIPEEVKLLFRTDSIKKNIRIHFPNGEREDIVNDNIVEESFSFTESICSQEKLKFGLCEASVVQFECVGIENIKGYEIAVYCEIDISSLSEEFITEYGKSSDDVSFPYYQIPYGLFIVDSCQRQADMRRRKVIGYSKGLPDNTILNPVEYAKFNGGINCKYNNPYNFNIYAFLYANIGKDFNGEMFQEKEEETIFGISYFTENSLGSSDVVYNSDRTNFNSKYVLELRLYTKREMFYEDNANLLCELGYTSLRDEDVKHIVDKINDICNNYGFKETLEGSQDEREELNYILDCLKKVFFCTDECEIDLEGYHYIYPYMGYSEEEVTEIKNSYGFVYSINVPATIEITLKEQHYNSYDVLQSDIILEEEITIRQCETDFICNKITNFKEIYMNHNRVLTEISGENRYSLKGCEFNAYNAIESTMELMGYSGRYGRDGNFELFKISDYFGLYPSETLYPNEDLYPKGSNAGIWTKSCYRSAWYDDELTKPYDRVSVTYINENGTEIYAYHAIVDEEAEGYIEKDYQTYSLSDNYFIQNGMFTSEQIKEILSSVAENIKNVRYMPADLELIGLPWIEAGDVIAIMTEDGAIETCILRRTLNGIQSLVDNFESKG